MVALRGGKVTPAAAYRPVTLPTVSVDALTKLVEMLSSPPRGNHQLPHPVSYMPPRAI